MRWVICALVVLALPASAFAGDFDVLRGPQTVGPANFYNWSGFYFGGDLGFNEQQANFSNATQPLVAYSLRELVLEEDDEPSEWPVLGNGEAKAAGYGGFLGYNMQWQDVVFGVEGNYTHTSLTSTASVSPIGWTTPSRVVTAGSYGYDVALTGTGRVTLTDYGEARARAGYVLGNFLPYGFVGAVIGGGSYSITTLANVTQSTLTPPFPCTFNDSTCQNFNFPDSVGQNNALFYGVSVGGGLDWALTPNIFLRGEAEFVQFAPVANVTFTLVKATVGAGLKF